jgi:hypothetical protein
MGKNSLLFFNRVNKAYIPVRINKKSYIIVGFILNNGKLTGRN